MKTRIVRIGNSQGIRIPKPLLEQAGLPEEVNLRAEAGRIVITPSRHARGNGGMTAAAAHANADDTLLEAPTSTRFDREEWTW